MKINVATTGDTSGLDKIVDAADKVVDAVEPLVNPAGMPGLEPMLDKAEDAADRVTEAFREMVGVTKQEQAELQKLLQLVTMSEAAVASQQKGVNANPNSPGAINGLADARALLNGDLAAVEALKQKVAARIKSTEATVAEAEATKRLAAEERKLAAEQKEQAAVQRRQEQEQRAAERAEQQALDVRRIKYNQMAQGIGFAAQQIAGASASIREVAAGAKGVDKDLAANLENTATALDGLQGAVAGAATGFTAGGPIGAIIGGLTGLGSAALKGPIDQLVASLENLGSVKAISVGLPGRIESVKKALMVKEQTLSWKALTDQIEKSNQAFDAAQTLQAAKDQSELFAAREKLRLAEVAGTEDQKTKARVNVAEMERRMDFEAIGREIAKAVQRVAATEQAATAKANQVLAASRPDMAYIEGLKKWRDNLDPRRDAELLDGLEKLILKSSKGGDPAIVKGLEVEFKELAKAAAEAKANLETIRQVGQIQASDNDLRGSTDMRIERQQQFDDKQGKAVSDLTDLAGQLEGNPNLAPVVAAINAALADKKLTASELQQIAGLLQAYERQIGSLGVTMLEHSRTMMGRVGELERQFRSLQQAVTPK